MLWRNLFPLPAVWKYKWQLALFPLLFLSWLLVTKLVISLSESASLACARGTRQRLFYTRQSLYRVLHTANGTRQIGVGKEDFCRVPFIGHTVNKF